MEVKDKLKNRRLELRLSMEDLAKKIGVTKSTISRWESGEIGSMKQTIIQKLADALYVDPIFFLIDDDEISDELNTLIATLNTTQKDKVIRFIKDYIKDGD